MPQAIRIKAKPTFRDTRGRFHATTEKLSQFRREALRDEGPTLKNIIIRRLRGKIGESKIDKGIRYNTQVRGDHIQLNVTAPSEARPHIIRAVNAQALAFFWPKVGMQTFVPKSGGFRTHVRGNALWIGKGYVNHPGGSLEPLMQPILADSLREWEKAGGERVLRKISTRWVNGVTT